MANVFKRVGRGGLFAWYVRYLDPISGKDVKKKLNAKTKREAELKRAEILNEINTGDFEVRQRQSEIRFFEIADDYLAFSLARKRSSLKDGRTIRNLKGFFGNVPCEKIYRSMIDRYIAERKAGQGRLGKPIQNSTINRELACLKTIFRRAHMDGKVARNPMAGFKLLPEDNVRDRVLTDEEYQKLLFACPAHLRPVIITAWETGMRKNEILRLKWQQVDTKNSLIQLYGDNTKTGKSRKVPISPFLLNMLSKMKPNNEWVFNFKGRHLTDVRTAFVKGCTQAGIQDFRFHDLRHCFVTRMRRNGIPDRVIMAITGHLTMECFKRYDSITVNDLRRAVGVGVPEKLEQFWNKGAL
jgi:integrase